MTMTTRRHPSSSLQKFFASPSMAFLLILPFSFLIMKSNAQIVPPCESFLPYSYDSGEIPNPIPPLQQQQVVVLIDSIKVSHTFAPWIQLDFSQTTLAPNVQLQLDGSNAQTQILDAKSLYASNGYSAVFDGESVSVKLVYDSSTSSTSHAVSSTIVPPLKKDLIWNAFRGSSNITSPKKPPKKPSSSPSSSSPPSSVSRVVISSIKVGLCGDDDEDNDDVTVSTICGSTDDRIRSYDVRQGRMGGCTAWLIGKNIFLRAGHCGDPNESTRLHFTSEVSNAPVSDQYAVDLSTYKFLNDGIGKDWAIGRLHPNSATGLLAGVAQSAKCNPSGTGDATCGWYKLGNAPSKTSGNTIRITGYGVHPDGRSQRTHVGALTSISSTSLQYSTDSEGGNSGSPVLHQETGLAIGIHTNGGCSKSGGANIGTKIYGSSTLMGQINTLTKPCTKDSDCDDKVVCNGVEICHPEGVCTAGAPVYGNGCPTLKPTLAPTPKPTPKPTNVPTAKPSTAMPTTKPSTAAPTTTPAPTTSQPSYTPTTAKPTSQP